MRASWYWALICEHSTVIGQVSDRKDIVRGSFEVRGPLQADLGGSGGHQQEEGRLAGLDLLLVGGEQLDVRVPAGQRRLDQLALRADL